MKALDEYILMVLFVFVLKRVFLRFLNFTWMLVAPGSDNCSQVQKLSSKLDSLVCSHKNTRFQSTNACFKREIKKIKIKTA